MTAHGPKSSGDSDTAPRTIDQLANLHQTSVSHSGSEASFSLYQPFLYLLSHQVIAMGLFKGNEEDTHLFL